MTCKHEFVGKKDGVTCKKCGLHMAHKDYVKSKQKNQKNDKQALK